MPTQNRNVTSTWADVSTPLSLTDGQDYLITNNGPRIIRLYEETSAPTDDNAGHEITPNGHLQFTKKASQNLYMRSQSGSADVGITEAN